MRTFMQFVGGVVLVFCTIYFMLALAIVSEI